MIYPADIVTRLQEEDIFQPTHVVLCYVIMLKYSLYLPFFKVSFYLQNMLVIYGIFYL